MKIEYLGHAAFMLKEGKFALLIDPYISQNPLAITKIEDLAPTHILVTHGHSDHLGDTLPIAARTGALVIAPSELANYCKSKGVLAHGMYQGTCMFEFGKLRMTQALHGSSLYDGGRPIYTGIACGYVIYLGEKCVYHAGDTGIFGDMKLIGEMNHPLDCALLPIGGNFTMDPEEALLAAKMLNPGFVVPMHYDTFPQIKQNAGQFVETLMRSGIKAKAMTPGETIEI